MTTGTSDRNPKETQYFGRPHRHRIYFLLAAFSVLSIVSGLFVNHRMLAAHRETIANNLQWVARLNLVDVLGKEAADLDAPAGNVFSSHDPSGEAARENAALANFQKTLEALSNDIQTNVPAPNVPVLDQDCHKLKERAASLGAQSELIFTLAAQGKFAEAAPQAAAKDRLYDALLSSLDDLRLDMRAQRKEFLDALSRDVDTFVTIEWVLGILIVGLVVSAVAYGIRLDRHAFKSGARARKVEERYRLLVELSPEGIFTVDNEWNINYANPAICRMSGYTQAEFEQLNVLDTYPPEERVAARQRREKLQAVPVLKFERTFLRKDGLRFPVEVSVNRIEENSFHAVVRDITDRKQAEDTRLRLSEIVESSQDAIVGTDLKGVITSWNAAAERLFGYTAAETVGQPIDCIIPEEDRGEKDDILRRLARGEQVSKIERVNLTKDGRRFPTELAISPIRTASGEIVGTSAIIRDITEVKRAAEQLHLQGHALEAAANAIVITDDRGRILWVNKAFTKLTGYSAGEVVGKTPNTLKSGEHDAAFYRDLWSTILAGNVWRGEMVNRRKDGSLYTEDMTITPVRSADGTISRFIAIKQDNSERKRADQELRDSKQRLEEALAELKTAQGQVIQQERLRALGTMASGVAHDFNNALAAILGFTELLLHRPENLEDKTKARRYLQMMNTAAQDAGNVVNRLREFYRHREAGEVLVPVDLNNLVREAIDLTQPKWKTQGEARGVAVRAETDLAEIPTVLGDAAGLREALTNLIFNAVDAMPDGGVITLRTRCAGGRVTLEVSDTGTGMTEEVRRRCLEPFFTTKGERGTGLGLSMVYGIVERHEGTIDIRTEVGQGTAFVLTLPARVEPPPAPVPAETGPAQAVSKRVLLVDDEELVRKILNEFLLGDGHCVELASNGRDALEKFRRGRFDLAIVDRAMPDMSGDQVAATVKQSAPDLPVIMLTGFGTMMEAAGELPPGVDLILSKPVTIAHLRDAMARAIAKN